MKRSVFLGLLLIMSLTIFAQEQKMSASEISVFKATIEKETKNIKSLKTDFIQYKHLDFLSKDIETSGKMYFKQPNLLNWQYTKPYQYSIVFKNNKVYINDQGNKSTVDANSKMFEKINKLIVGSVSGNMFDDKEFAIAYFKNKDAYIAKLTPKTTTIKKYIKQVDLYFPMDEATVSQVKLIEPSGDFTRIVFKNKQINAKVDDSVFTN
ncbi:outer membrane lipoprotein carrier protein [Flavobacterium cauense R2A-7]|uniref:Outer membrane lipoprotein carrier protein n=1 Tax=Flavobacterium cauense R2A-7 TaxID=1341154 RepID=A0A562LXG2_9FLAO|nr:outer membrane lipoprotein carrier protein LolA [Flavobacterium cauense]KGO83728.1 cell envelope biogenesis protein LolA [Flavobacterium cauense R2A-7]TWI12341.1 outer membrane lipoprotein carrier protein [Flavobacterium cauense R2A-7]